MNETKFTPGPWRVVEFSGRTHVVVSDRGGVARSSEAMNPNMNADVLLIAAAPDLYAALEAFVAHYAKLAYSGDCGNWNPEDEDEFRAASAALAKARGEK